MAKTYASAPAIVILDHELQQIKHLGKPVSELLGLLACSAWMSRCWTFQEGALARKWLIQFDDGILRPDMDLESSDSGAVLSELRKFLADVPRLSPIGRNLRSFKARSLLFLKIWNGICTRSTTKRDDLISIIAILLSFRTAELIEMPARRRLLSLICAQDVLTLPLMYRERPALKDWSEGCQWLPSTIEEVPIDISGDALWRRAPLNDFFVLKRPPADSIPGYQKTRLYFTQTSGGPDDSTLKLIDEDTNEHINIKLGLSDDLRLPQLHICLVIQYSSIQVDRSSFEGATFGACLGVRYQRDGFVQLHYICPVTCAIFLQSHVYDEVQSSDPVAIVKQEDLAGTTEYAVEYRLGVLFLPVSLFGKGLPAERVLLVIALVIETEVGVLLFKWLLELYASTSPRIINLPARLAFMTTSNATMHRQTQWFFRRLYANSRLTIFFGRVLGINSLTVPFRKPHVAISFDNCPELLTSNIPNTIEACESAMEPRKNAAAPWNDRDVEIFSLSTNAPTVALR
ncbi:hypothetical protein BGZ57DRAFT_963414 [Hyaloscypha finlandica]|nr:hypothetical protein BGZ57DRAFT_963414 [Hyaloscypha finlandica]